MHPTPYPNLALRAPDLVTVDDVARARRISKAHLAKVAADLARRGGMRLARLSEESITVGEVLHRTEAPLHPVACFSPDTNTCLLPPLARLGAGAADLPFGAG